VLSCQPSPKLATHVKTADRILVTARRLFNERGESNVTASDIALELDISPGNLYYHFKGTDSINLALFAQLQRDMIGLLGTSIRTPELFSDCADETPVQRSWLFLTLVLELMLAYRYLYENPNALMHRFPEIDRGFKRLIRLKRAACEAIATELLSNTSRAAPEETTLERLTDAMTLTLNYWISYDQLCHPQSSDTVTVHRGVLQLLSFCAPYLGDDQQLFYAECEQLYKHMLVSGDA